MGKEIHVFGPPGSGKTTYICNQIIPDMTKEYGEHKLMITSFTRTAAKNIAERAELEDNERYGTLHSICYAALGRPPMVETVIKEWNNEYPALAVKSSSDASGHSDPFVGELFGQYNLLRNLLTPKDNWPQTILDFSEKWETFKKRTGTVDFTDMITMGKEKFISPPFGISALLVDEAQDFTPLQISLLRSWGVVAGKTFYVYDDDQAIFSFQGSDVSVLMNPTTPIPKENKIYLTKSYRVPAIPHAYAMKISDRISEREEKTYTPTNRSGSVCKGEGSITDPDWCIDKALELPGSAMIMASCGYMLSECIGRLRERGIPFYNPYKKEDNRWNPLGGKAVHLLYQFMQKGEDEPYWSTEQLLDWITEIKTNNPKKGVAGVNRGVKKMFKILEEELLNQTPGLHTCRKYIQDILHDDALQAALDRDVDWLEKSCKSAISQRLEFALNILKSNNMDPDILKQDPKIMIGTIHSFKGTEAENVFVFPNISFAGQREWDASIKGKDNTHRLMYVAVTRTKNNLFIMPSGTNGNRMSYDFPEMEDLSIF
jgi:DNA helicase-2/ATP-dependent DNA helicase PcrA